MKFDYDSDDDRIVRLYSRSGSVPISNEKVEEWIRECVQYLQDHPNEEYYSVSSGNRKVLVTRGEDDTLEIEVSQPVYDGYVKLN
jgi:hypothetical protein